VWREAAGIVRSTALSRTREPRDDLLTSLLQAGASEERLDEDDLLATVLSLAVAGHETTANMLVNAVHHLLRLPDKLAALRADRTIMGSAIEEFLRYESPPRNSVSRYPIEDVELGGTLIRRDAQVYVGYQAANHDPAEFADPLELNLRRSPNRHLGLGIGVHHCLGCRRRCSVRRLRRRRLEVHWSPLVEVGSVDRTTASQPRARPHFYCGSLGESRYARRSSHIILQSFSRGRLRTHHSCRTLPEQYWHGRESDDRDGTCIRRRDR
jgi:hypothetical protein